MRIFNFCYTPTAAPQTKTPLARACMGEGQGVRALTVAHLIVIPDKQEQVANIVRAVAVEVRRIAPPPFGLSGG